MSSLVQFSMRQYAVISVRALPHCERLVIAYHDEKTLRNLLAEPSIVALGYSSREEAEASISGYGRTPQPLRRKSMPRFVANCTKAVKQFVRGPLQAKDAFSWGKAQHAICDLLQQILVAVVVVIYSRNLLSAAIRAFISF